MRLLDRRRLLLSGFAASGLLVRSALAASAGAAASGLAGFGARGDGFADDTAAVQAALSSGRMIDGGGLTYGVSGQVEAGPGFAGLSNCTLRQLARADHLRTLQIQGARDFRLSNVTVIRGDQDDEALIQRDMQLNGGLWIEDCRQFTLDHVEVRGGGIGTGVTLYHCDSFTAADLRSSGIHYRLRERPTDDMLQGIWAHQSTRFELVRPTVSDLGGQDDLGFSRDNNRAIAVSACSGFKISDLDVSQCGQGLDVTGAAGNHDFEVDGGHAADCWTWGFKFANSAFRGRVAGALAERCGLGGFVVSGPTKPSDPPPQDIEFADCRAVDCGRPGLQNTTVGFGVMFSHLERDYPRRIRFVRCRAEDRRSPPGMRWAFYNEIETPPGQANTLEDCSQSGSLVAPERGFQQPVAAVSPS